MIPIAAFGNEKLFLLENMGEPTSRKGSKDAVVRAVIQQIDGIKLQVDVVGLDLTPLIDTKQVV